jgi:hypothetical protein
MPTWTRHLYEHNPLAIAKGEVNGYSVVHKFGANNFTMVLVKNTLRGEP